MTKTLALPRGSGSGRRMALRGRPRVESGEWSQEREDGWGGGWPHPSHPSQYLLILSPVTTCVTMITILLALTQVTLGKWPSLHHYHCHYHCHRRAGLDVSLQSCGGDRGQAAPVRDVRGRGRAPVSLHQRDARLQRQVVQERQGVLQVGSAAPLMAKWAEFMKISASLAGFITFNPLQLSPGQGWSNNNSQCWGNHSWCKWHVRQLSASILARTHVDILPLFSPHYRVSPLSSQN